MPKHVIRGSAGAGKTYKIISIVESLLSSGYRPNDICLCTYTRSAANEAIDRMTKKFGLDKKQLMYFNTIHGLCYRHFCINKKVVREQDKQKFFELNNIDYEYIKNDGDTLTGEFNNKTNGNMILSFYDSLRINLCKDITDFKSEAELKNAFIKLENNNIDFSSIFANSFNAFKILNEYKKFLEERDLVDFVEMLLLAYKNKFIIPTKILIIDESQDLNRLQFFIYQLWAQNKEEIYLAGDPNQVIYSFSSASADFLLNEIKSLDPTKGDSEIVLPHTFRMMSKINDHCHLFIEKNIRKEKHKTNKMEPDKIGGIIENVELDGDIQNILKYIRSDKNTFVLFRTNYYKHEFINKVLIPNGVIYWEIRGQSIWSNLAINLFNAIVNLIEDKSLDVAQAHALFESVPFKLGLLKRGAKSQFKNKDKKEEYRIKDLLDSGFNDNIKQFLSYDKLIDILDISDSLRDAFRAAKKEIIQTPIKLKISTIHGSKGHESQDCLVCFDCSKKVATEARKNIDNFESEIRVFYVGQSRARERLVILRGGFKNGDSNIIP